MSEGKAPNLSMHNGLSGFRICIIIFLSVTILSIKLDYRSMELVSLAGRGVILENFKGANISNHRVGFFGAN